MFNELQGKVLSSHSCLTWHAIITWSKILRGFQPLRLKKAFHCRIWSPVATAITYLTSRQGEIYTNLLRTRVTKSHINGSNNKNAKRSNKNQLFKLTETTHSKLIDYANTTLPAMPPRESRRQYSFRRP